MSRGRLPASKARLGRRVFLSDGVFAFVAPLLAYFVRDPNILESTDLSTLVIYALLSAIVSAVSFRAFRIAQGIPRYFSFHDAIEIVKASGASVAAISAILFSFTRLEDVPRSVPIIHVLLLAGFLIATRLWRRGLGQRADRAGAQARTIEQEEAILLVGVTRLAWFYVRIIDMFGLGHRRVLGLLDVDPALVGRSVFGHFVLGAPGDARHLVDDFAMHGVPVRAFVVCERGRAAAAALRAGLEPLARERGIAIEMLAKQLGIDDDETEAMAADADNSVDRAPRYLRIRRFVDASASGLALIVLAPVFLVVAASVWSALDAPVIFWQRRVGRGGTPIHVYKFRSLRNPVDRSGRMLSDADRETRFGAFLRATRLDELPQLYNVVRGDMALIGPRPLLPVDQPAESDIRLSVAPGITGWAQTHGGKLVDAEKKNALDEYYVRNASLRLDARIALRTVKTVVFGDRLEQPPDASVRRGENDDDDDDRKAA